MTFLSHLFKGLTVLAIAIIVVMSLRPSVAMGGVPHIDKVLHFAAYAILAGLARLGWPKLWGGWIFLVFAILGVGIEIAQHLMNVGRMGSLGDVAANLIGAALPLILFHIFWTRQHR